MRPMLPVPAQQRTLASFRSAAPSPSRPITLRTVLTTPTHRLCVRPLLPQRDIGTIQSIHSDSETCFLSRGIELGATGPMGRDEARSLVELWHDEAIFGTILCLLPRSWDQDCLLQQYLDQEQVVGMMALTTPLGKAEPSKFGVALSLEYQGQGYGKASLRWLLDQAFSRPLAHSSFGEHEVDEFDRLAGVKVIEGETLMENQRARGCWKKLGFKEVEEKGGKVHVRITRAEWQQQASG